jgi:hypothetical protein
MPEDKPERVQDQEEDDDKDGCYWKLLPQDSREEFHAELDKCRKEGTRIQFSRIKDEDGKEWLSIAKRVPIGE